MKEIDPFLSKPRSKKEVCEWLDCSLRFLECEIKTGRLRARRLSGRLIRIMPSDIEAWLDNAASVPVQREGRVKLREFLEKNSQR